jgi:hypothetical protein
MKLPWTNTSAAHPRIVTTRPPAVEPDVIALHHCAQCTYETAMPDEHWITINGTSDQQQRATVCSPLCGVLWLEAVYRPTALGVAR